LALEARHLEQQCGIRAELVRALPVCERGGRLLSSFQALGGVDERHCLSQRA
jgi:hypothetical protein